MESEKLNWRVSSHSGNGGATCVEVASTTGKILVRDTTARTRGHLAVTPETFRALLATIRRGELGLGELGREA
jgi:hypothetical protein